MVISIGVQVQSWSITALMCFTLWVRILLPRVSEWNLRGDIRVWVTKILLCVLGTAFLVIEFRSSDKISSSVA